MTPRHFEFLCRFNATDGHVGVVVALSLALVCGVILSLFVSVEVIPFASTRKPRTDRTETHHASTFRPNNSLGHSIEMLERQRDKIEHPGQEVPQQASKI